MKNDPAEIHFDCPKCKRPMSGDKALLAELINCPDCDELFTPVPRPPEPASPPLRPAAKPTPTTSLPLQTAKQRADQIHVKADIYGGLAVAFFVIGLLVTLAAFATPSLFIVAASLIGAAFWMYLIAQIMHIRANTEK